MRLNKNQILNSVRNAMRRLREVTDGLEEDDIREILQQCAKLLLPDDKALVDDNTPEAMQERILKAINDGLKGSDPQMVRAAMEWVEEHSGREYLSELQVNIVPYTIKDASLKNIVLKAGDDVVREIAGALKERRAKGRVIEAAAPEE